jgi:pullulanase
VLAAYPPDSPEQQAAVMATAAEDGFNWGYDPLHYTTPEGSYSTDPDGPQRIVEFREMVQSLNGTGLRVVMDVVYNHTHASGQDALSVLDRIVPGYYHRLNDAGAVETSTCCANTATEHEMMGKLMIDSVVTWAKEYKVDGFRFDLMGHHSKQNMLDLRAALDELTLETTASTVRRSTCTARAGTSARSRTTPASCRRRSSTWAGPASARSPTGCATPCAAAARSTAVSTWSATRAS